MDITPVIEVLIAAVTTVLVIYAVPALVRNYGVEKVTDAFKIITILVEAAEQITTTTGAGTKKKAWVIERLKDYNITIDEAKVSELIEAAVLKMKNNINE